MDKIDLALRHYRRMLLKPQTYIDGAVARELQVWLKNDVCPIVHDYARRPAFREQATWVLRTLAKGAHSAERRQVNAVDAALVRCARAILQLASKKLVGAELARLTAPNVSDARANKRMAARKGADKKVASAVDGLVREIRLVDTISRRPWGDLVNLQDYFEPQQEFIEVAKGRPVQRGEFIVTLNPELLPAGNFVVRCLFRRIETEREVLVAARRKLSIALTTIKRKIAGQNELKAAWTELEKAIGQLEATLHPGGEHALRDSCMLLTQLYAVFHSSPDLNWLNLPRECIDRHVPHFRQRLRGLYNGELFDRIAAAFGDLKRLYCDGLPDQSRLEEAIATGGLVLDQSARIVWWEQKKLTVDWTRHDRAWDFLLALAGKARRSQPITERDLFRDKGAAPSSMSTGISRLKPLIPPSLRKCIFSGPGIRAYRLELDSGAIHIF